MTRKDYVAFAGAIKKITNPSERGSVAAVVAKVCQQDNTRFDKVKFYKACWVAYE